MAPENVQVIHLPDIDFFKNFLKINQAQEICKNLRIYPSLHERPNLVYWNRKTAPALTAKHMKMCIDWVKKKSNTVKREMGNRGVFW